MKHAPPLGFEQVPPGGMCVCAYLFVARRGKILLGKYADDPQWEALAGLEPERRRTHGWGWTVPATHLKLGEDPREAARRGGEEILKRPGPQRQQAKIRSAPSRFPAVARANARCHVPDSDGEAGDCRADSREHPEGEGRVVRSSRDRLDRSGPALDHPSEARRAPGGSPPQEPERFRASRWTPSRVSSLPG